MKLVEDITPEYEEVQEESVHEQRQPSEVNESDEHRDSRSERSSVSRSHESSNRG